MKKTILPIMLSAVLLLGACATTKSPELQKYEAKQKELDLNTDLNKLKIELEKERMANQKLSKSVAELNAKADKNTNRFNSSDPSSTASDAKATARLLRDVEKANRNLKKSNRKIESIQKNIKKTDEKISKLTMQINAVGQNK
ncbi:MAG: SlyB protein [Pedobacter sp.]|nr:MAG: SlyB protein [Pedobacter sp.]